MFSRFQKEKMQRAKKSSIYNLGDDNDEDNMVLTHKGQILGESNFNDKADWPSSDDDERNQSLGKEVVDRLHFGGGFESKKNNSNDYYGPASTEDNTRPKSRLDALQEIVMKSKLHKLQRKEAKEEQEDERENLDKAFEALVGDSLLSFKPTKRDRGSHIDGSTFEDQFSSYDKSLREMAYEAKVQPTDRTKTAEELALEARTRLEALEAERLRRMKVTVEGDEEKHDSTSKDTKRKGRKERKNKETNKVQDKKRRVTDDEIDHTFGSSYLHENNGMLDPYEEEEVDDFEDDIDVNDDEDEEDNEDEDEEDNEDEEEEEDEDDEDEDDEEEDDEDEDDEEEDDEDEENEEEDEFNVNNWRQRKLKKLIKQYDDTVNEQMPHKIECPTNIEEFYALIDKYVNSFVDMKALLDRILAWNSVHLPGAQGQTNKNLMHNFLDILLKHFVNVGDSLSYAGEKQKTEIRSELDYLVTYIFTLCQDISDAVPSLFGRTIKILHSQLQKRLREYALGNIKCTWPSLGKLLLFKLSGHIFSVTDFRHSIISSMSLLLCQCLVQCSVNSVKDLASGLLVCSILIDYHAETGKYIPEVPMFLRSIFSMYCDPSLFSQQPVIKNMTTFEISALSWLRPTCALLPDGTHDTSVPWSCFNKDKEEPVGGDKSLARAPLIAYSILAVTQDLLQAYSDNIQKNQALHPSLPEILQPIIDVLRALRPQDSPSLVTSIQAKHVALLEALVSRVEHQQTSRAPLQWRVEGIKNIVVKNPSYTPEYTFKKDMDPDQNRAKLKQLNRQLKRENKAAMRELRRDSDFIDQERFKRVTEESKQRQDARHKNFAALTDSVGELNKQIRMSKGAAKGGGSGVTKRARIK